MMGPFLKRESDIIALILVFVADCTREPKYHKNPLYNILEDEKRGLPSVLNTGRSDPCFYGCW